MSWLAETLPPVLLAFAVGLLVGRLVWRTSWRKVRTTRRELLGHLALAHERHLADRDQQLAVLRDQLDEERDESARRVAALERELRDCRRSREAHGAPDGSPRVASPSGVRSRA